MGHSFSKPLIWWFVHSYILQYLSTFPITNFPLSQLSILFFCSWFKFQLVPIGSKVPTCNNLKKFSASRREWTSFQPFQYFTLVYVLNFCTLRVEDLLHRSQNRRISNYSISGDVDPEVVNSIATGKHIPETCTWSWTLLECQHGDP